MLLNLPKDVSVARFRLCVHTLHFETATWNSTSSPTCDSLHASSDVKSLQEDFFLKVACLFTPGKQQTPSFRSFYFMNRRAVILLD